MLPTPTVPALLVLEDGTAFHGRSFGAPGTTFGEAVFNTAMAGYQEVLTDPSYRGQVVAMTSVQVGNYGVNSADVESGQVQVAGFVVREASRRASSWRSEGTLGDLLVHQGVVAIDGVDTRALTRVLREAGAMRCAISTEVLDVDRLVEQVRAQPTMEGRDLAADAGTREPYTIEADGGRRFRVTALDFGMKRNIGRLLAAHGCEVTVLPARSTVDEILATDPDGLFLSNGPGDPAPVTYGIEATRALLGRLPVFGICLGSQLMGLALGGTTYKLRYGHHGVNLPVLRRATRQVEITSQNHGFAVDAATLGEQVDEFAWQTADHGRVEVTHVNMNDDTVAGIACDEVGAFAVQYHPEAAPGPHDARYLFEQFTDLMARRPANA